MTLLDKFIVQRHQEPTVIHLRVTHLDREATMKILSLLEVLDKNGLEGLLESGLVDWQICMMTQIMLHRKLTGAMWQQLRFR